MYFEWAYVVLLDDWFPMCSDSSLVECLFHMQQVSSSIPSVTKKLIFSPFKGQNGQSEPKGGAE
jgi:hypothetical protein